MILRQKDEQFVELVGYAVFAASSALSIQLSARKVTAILPSKLDDRRAQGRKSSSNTVNSSALSGRRLARRGIDVGAEA
jgi:hypothetical protein